MSVLEASRGHAIEAQRGRAVLTMLRVGALGMLLGFAIGAALVWAATDIGDRHTAQAWARRQLDPAALLGIRRPATSSVAMTVSPEHEVAVRVLTRAGIAGSVVALLLGSALTALLWRQWVATARTAARDQLLKGNRVATAREVANMVKPGKGSRPIMLGDVPLPPGSETRHLLLVGRTGSGKSTALHHIVDQIAAREEAAIIFDPDGSYTEAFYQPARGDVILNPLDARSARWNPVADVAGLLDAYRIASILIPKPAGSSEAAIWYDQARLVVAHVIDHLARSGTADLDTLSHMLNTASADTLRAIVADTSAARIFEPGAERAGASVLFMTSIAARTVATLAMVARDAPAFSFDAFLADLDKRTGPRPFVFLSIPRRVREAGTPLVAAWIDAAASAILQRRPGAGSNIWIMLDELASLPAIGSLLTLLPEGRKHGACVTFGFQSISQLRQVYGEDGAQVLTGQTACQLIMATGDHATAQWAVNLAGSVEVENQRATATLDTDAKAERGSLATTRERKTLLLDAELADLAIGEGFLRLAGLPIARVRIAPREKVPPVAPDFLPAATPAPPIVAAPVPPPQRVEDRDDWLTLGGPF